MSRVIFKYPLATASVRITMPKGAQVLSARWQTSAYEDGPQVQAIADPSEALSELRHFVIATTGTDVPTNAVFIDTIESPSDLILHIFELV